MDTSPANAPWILAARDIMHVAELAYGTGKYPVAALLCHWAANRARRGATATPRRGGPKASKDASAGPPTSCSPQAQAFLAQLASVAAALEQSPRAIATLVTRDDCSR